MIVFYQTPFWHIIRGMYINNKKLNNKIMKKITGIFIAIAAFTIGASAQDSTKRQTKKPMKNDKTWQKDSTNKKWDKNKTKKYPKKDSMRSDSMMLNRDSM